MWCQVTATFKHLFNYQQSLIAKKELNMQRELLVAYQNCIANVCLCVYRYVCVYIIYCLSEKCTHQINSIRGWNPVLLLVSSLMFCIVGRFLLHTAASSSKMTNCLMEHCDNREAKSRDAHVQN